MTMSRLSLFSRFSVAFVALRLLHCGSQPPAPSLEMCPDGTVSAHCVPMTCIDNIRNGAETDVDCGGPTCEKCTVKQVCATDTDCDTGHCAAGVCAIVVVENCTDGIKNGSEADVDCGGTSCPTCANGKACGSAIDCSSAFCSGTVCANPPPICTDGLQNGTESDIDCGGATCGKCANGKKCGGGADCTSATCSGGVCVAPPPTCTDGIKNGTESDIDCGGATCGKCANGKACGGGSDCASATCSGGVCVAPPATCTDGIKNGSETDVDCGGPTCNKCVKGQRCAADRDCTTGTCNADGLCAVIVGHCTIPFGGGTIVETLTDPPYTVAMARSFCAAQGGTFGP